MPDIIEDGDASQIEQRAHRARAAAALAQLNAANRNQHRNNNNNNNPNPQRRVARPHNVDDDVPAEDVVVAASAAAAAANPNNNNDNQANNRDDATEIMNLARHMARMVGVDVRPMFRRLGVRRLYDVRYIREKDLDGLARITMIQKRKLWAIAKYVATDHAVTASTTLKDVVVALNLHKKKLNRGENDDDADHNDDAPTLERRAIVSVTARAPQHDSHSSAGIAVVPSMSHATTTLIDDFDGSHQEWLLWNKKTYHGLAQTHLGDLLTKGGDTGTEYAEKTRGYDTLLFHILARAIVGGSANHLIRKAEQASIASENKKSSSTKKKSVSKNDIEKPSIAQASGRKLWELLQEEYTKGPMAFYIISDARQILQKLVLVGPSKSSKRGGGGGGGGQNDTGSFLARSAHEYVDRFRFAKETLEDYQQALPDSFLAFSFVEHIQDQRLEAVQKQLIQDLTTKQLSLDQCFNKVLMAAHLVGARAAESISNLSNDDAVSSSDVRDNRKRSLYDGNDGEGGDDAKRPKLPDGGGKGAAQKDS